MNYCKRLAVALLLAALSATPAWAGFDEGLAAYNQKDYATALREWRPLAAAQGDAYAQLGLGEMYNSGEGVEQDYVEALKWFRLAAEQGNPYAQVNVGWMNYKGQGVVQDDAEALKWFRLAASQGNALALYALGAFYQAGTGVPLDKVAAYALYDLVASIDSSKEIRALASRGAIAEEMSKAEIEAAQALTREMVGPGNPLRALDAYLASKKKR